MPPPAEILPGSVTWLTTDTGPVIHLSGEIDLCLAPLLSGLTREVAEERIQIVVDLAEVTFCDATLATFLVELLDRGPVTVRAPNGLVRDVIRLCGLDRRVLVVG